MTQSTAFSVTPEWKMRTLITSVHTLGALALAVLATIIAMASLINLAIVALDEICTRSAELVIRSDALVR